MIWPIPIGVIAGDVDQAREYVRGQPQLCTLGSGVKAQGKAGRFVIHFGIDTGANEVGDLALRSARDGFLLDTSKLAKLIHQELTDLGQKAAPAQQWQDQKRRIAMLRCLVVAFALRPNRQQERIWPMASCGWCAGSKPCTAT